MISDQTFNIANLLFDQLYVNTIFIIVGNVQNFLLVFIELH